MVQFFKNNQDSRIAQQEILQKKCWIDMVNPTDSEVKYISEQTGIPEQTIKAALDEEERAHTDFDDGVNTYIVDTPITIEEDGNDVYTTLPLALIYNNDYLITVCLKGNTVLKNFIIGKIKVNTAKPVHFILEFMLGNAQRFQIYLRQIDKKSNRVQAIMEKNMKNDQILEILDLENALVYFSTSLNANYRVHEKLAKVEVVVKDEEYADLYDELVIESRQAIEMCNIYKDILTVTMDAYSSVISNNANDTMSRLTVVTVLLAIPTMIAGFWGMNMKVPFEDGANQEGTLWFWLVVIGTLILTLVVGALLFSNKVKGVKKHVKRKKRRNKDKK